MGSPPFDARHFKRGAILEMLRMVREDEPARPSTKLSCADALPSIAANRAIEPAKLTRFLRGELDWVVMKALEKDRTRRYETANGFARDIQRYLADEVVEARPPSRGYRMRKFIRRNRPQVIAASLVLVTLLAGIAGTTVGLLRAREQRNLAEYRLGQLTEANAKTETERTRAEQNFGTARALILDLGNRIHQIETGQKNPKLADLARKQALDRAREQFEKFRAGQPDDVTLMKQAALLHRFAANVSRSLTDDAARFAVRGSELWDQVKTAPATERLNIDPLFAAMAVHRVALAQRELANTAKAMTAHDDAVARMKLLAGPKATRDERYWDCEVRRERARTALAVPQRRAAAIADLAGVILPSEKLIEENPHLYFYKAGLASTYLYRGELLLSLEQPEPATAELTKSLAVSRELLDRHGVLTRSMLIRGNTFPQSGGREPPRKRRTKPQPTGKTRRRCLK